jgi:hypothetical protein
VPAISSLSPVRACRRLTDADPVTAALVRPHRMLERLDTRLAHRRPDDPAS